MEKATHKRRFEGIVVSTKMQKTVVVRVDRVKVHPKYGKRFTVSKNYKAHDETGMCHEKDRVLIEETRPISRDKRWRVISVLTQQKD
ncbi:MAG: 30S ribosomal protein S17 [Candidatus Komeilibacteria bacterium RIFCSPLOWO2_01_FULL_52_15]|uniref:Small ribosomal subunit protein uS17 n=2 Tax=Candidatus Komeiliibacteriota TaxID=1817908 RepID=A0A1G2BPH1_9BACT|nr:MAG: 30S ribosomal protein S17 [Candidatus Komeilibacteria bacterium RIFCSPHIGHO2_01_FULL_52_14]OGY91014.1 MAG: 30S ribosomal protein S17 [Candidatus Komeilibacteria bacterium RIFCSPLOWO2_01_FULL_52_15]